MTIVDWNVIETTTDTIVLQLEFSDLFAVSMYRNDKDRLSIKVQKSADETSQSKSKSLNGKC